MAKGHDYQMLLNLRNAIVGAEQARTKIQDAKGEITTVEKTQKELGPEKVHYSYYTKALEKEYAAPYNQKALKKANIRDVGLNCARTWFFVLLIGAILVVGYWVFAKFVFSWSWTNPIEAMQTGEGALEKGQAISVYLIPYVLVFVGAGALLWFLYEQTDEDWMNVCKWISFGVAIVFAIASAAFYLQEGEGFFDFVLNLIGLPVAIFLYFSKVLTSLFFAIVFLISLIAPLAAAIGLICLLRSFDEISTYRKPEIDYTPLYETKKYKEAKELDRKEEAELQREADRNYEKKKENLAKKKLVLNTSILQYNTVLARCNKIIAETDIHPSYKNLEKVDNLLYYFEYNRADTLIKAVNELISDQKFLTLKTQLTTQHAATIKQMQTNMATLTKKLDHMENSITEELGEIVRATERQTSAITSEINRLNQQSISNTDRVIFEMRN